MRYPFLSKVPHCIFVRRYYYYSYYKKLIYLTLFTAIFFLDTAAFLGKGKSSQSIVSLYDAE